MYEHTDPFGFRAPMRFVGKIPKTHLPPWERTNEKHILDLEESIATYLGSNGTAMYTLPTDCKHWVLDFIRVRGRVGTLPQKDLIELAWREVYFYFMVFAKLSIYDDISPVRRTMESWYYQISVKNGDSFRDVNPSGFDVLVKNKASGAMWNYMVGLDRLQYIEESFPSFTDWLNERVTTLRWEVTEDSVINEYHDPLRILERANGLAEDQFYEAALGIMLWRYGPSKAANRWREKFIPGYKDCMRDGVALISQTREGLVSYPKGTFKIQSRPPMSCASCGLDAHCVSIRALTLEKDHEFYCEHCASGGVAISKSVTCGALLCGKVQCKHHPDHTDLSGLSKREAWALSRKARDKQLFIEADVRFGKARQLSDGRVYREELLKAEFIATYKAKKLAGKAMSGAEKLPGSGTDLWDKLYSKFKEEEWKSLKDS